MSFDVICFTEIKQISKEILLKLYREESLPLFVFDLNDALTVASSLSCKKIFIFTNDEGVISANDKKQNVICEITYDKALEMPCFGNYLITPKFIKKCKDLNVEIIIGNDRRIKGTRVKNSVSHN